MRIFYNLYIKQAFLQATVKCYNESVIGEPGILIPTNADYSNFVAAQPQPLMTVQDSMEHFVIKIVKH